MRSVRLSARTSSCHSGAAAHQPEPACLRHGTSSESEYLEGILDHGERLMRDAIRELPDGVHTGRSGYENDCFEPLDVPIVVSVTVSGDAAQCRDERAVVPGSGPALPALRVRRVVAWALRLADLIAASGGSWRIRPAVVRASRRRDHGAEPGFVQNVGCIARAIDDWMSQTAFDTAWPIRSSLRT